MALPQMRQWPKPKLWLCACLPSASNTTNPGLSPYRLPFQPHELVAFDQGPPCEPDGCDGTDVCANGICVPGPEAPGGLGALCTGDTECISHQCANGGEELMHCVMACDLGNKASCPEHFDCLDTGGGGGVCWFTGSGCCQTGTGPQGPILLGLGAAALLLRRRRRRP